MKLLNFFILVGGKNKFFIVSGVISACEVPYKFMISSENMARTHNINICYYKKKLLFTRQLFYA